MGSYVFTDEEASYLKAVLNWQEPRDSSPVAAKRRLRPAKLHLEVKPKQEEATTQPVSQLRVLVLGAKGTGKTSILNKVLPLPNSSHHQITNRVQLTQTTSSPPHYSRQTLHLDNLPYNLDTLEFPSDHLPPNQVSPNPALQQAISITEAAVLLYSIDDHESLALTRGLAESIHDSTKGRKYGLVLVGNKSDLDDEEREVSWAEGAKAAAGMGCGFVEVSALTGDNVGRMWEGVGREVVRLRGLEKERARRRDEGDDEGNGMTGLEKWAREARGKPEKKRGLWRRVVTPFFRR
jgi:GTPase SAR1 family protein